MAALTDNITSTFQDPGTKGETRYVDVAASTKIYMGALVGENAAGAAIVPTNTATTVRILGYAVQGYDNSASLSATTTKPLQVRTNVILKCTCTTTPVAGQLVYAQNDNPADILAAAGAGPAREFGRVIEVRASNETLVKLMDVI